MPSILLIDDKLPLLEVMEADLRAALDDEAVNIITWVPNDDSGEDPHVTFKSLVDEDTILVVTDHDLTSQGQTGLFGSSIVAWCQQRAIPVGDFSRGNPSGLPRNPDLFELRIPTNETGAKFIAGVYKGFRDIRDALVKDSSLLELRSPAAVLAMILDVPEAENQFALYMPRLAPASGALMSILSPVAPANSDEVPEEVPDASKRMVLAYIAGHLLLNSILRFPGPILSTRALKAILATDGASDPMVQALFEAARYEGPFATLDAFYWREGVEAELTELLSPDDHAESPGELYRIAIERKLATTFKRHHCERCTGTNGGFYCPFTNKTVCLRTDCSVGSSSWIPQGATLCRIERVFFDEWAPILGF